MIFGLFQDGTSCIIEASRNGHTRVVEALLNWCGVPSSRNPQSVKSAALQTNRVKKVL